MTREQDYLEAYDTQLRTEAETTSAVSVARLGPLWLVTFPRGRGFVTYQNLAGGEAPSVTRWVEEALAHFRADRQIERVEWKTRGHDHAPGLHDALVRSGFVAEDTESVMVGEAGSLVVDVPLPEGVSLRQVSSAEDVRAMAAMEDEVFGDPVTLASADALLHRLSLQDGLQLWVAEFRDEIVCAGRLEPVPNTEFAGIWGGATRPHWRGRGIYRALTAARARSAIALGKRLIHSDSTEFSRPILERSGLLKVTTTTPYIWKRS